jgi:hypothetical protein
VWPFAVCLAACGGAAASGPPPPETITVAPPPEPPAAPAQAELPHWIDASAPAAPELAAASPAASAPPAEDAGLRPALRIGAVTVTGARTADLVQKALLGATPEMSRCHEAASSGGARPAGVVRVKLVVAGSGQIVSATEVGGRGEKSFVRCVLDAARRVRFTRAVGGNVEVNFPVQFGP